jgi:hypothetical protein
MVWRPIESSDELADAHETSTFDLKQKYDLKLHAFEMAKDVAAFASAMGGTIVVGAVEGTGDRKGRIATFKPVATPGEFETKLGEAIRRRCRPQPVWRTKQLTLDENAQTSILGRTPDSPTTNVVLVNVWPLAKARSASRSLANLDRSFPMRSNSRCA